MIQKDGVEVRDANETWALIDDTDRDCLVYPRSKAESERLVLAADGVDGSEGKSSSGKEAGKGKAGMRTTTLRPSVLHGEHDNDVTPILLRRGAKRNIQIGTNTSPFAITYVGNSAAAHLLAGEKLCSEDAGVRDSVGGQTFFVTNEEGEYYTYYDFARIVWQHAGMGDGPAGLEYQTGNVRVIPVGVAIVLAWVCEVWAWISGSPPWVSRAAVGICTMTRLYDISKAKRVLGYKPLVSWEEEARKAARVSRNIPCPVDGPSEVLRRLK